MKSSGGNSLKDGNIGRVGRQEGNKLKKAIELIGEENLRTLVEMHLETALNDEDKKLRASCQAFLIDRFVPKKSNESYIKITFLPMNSMENIKQNEDIIFQNMCDGSISMEKSERLLSMIEQARKTYETTELARLMEEMDERMTENGM